LPDLRERFVVGAGGDNTTVIGNAYSVGDKGGLVSIKLKGKQIPQHDHNFDVFNTDPNVSYAFKYKGSEGVGSLNPGIASYVGIGNNLAGDNIGTTNPKPKHKTGTAKGYTTDNPPTTITMNGDSQYDGETTASVPVENRPPYFALCYIIKL